MNDPGVYSCVGRAEAMSGSRAASCPDKKFTIMVLHISCALLCAPVERTMHIVLTKEDGQSSGRLGTEVGKDVVQNKACAAAMFRM